MKVAALLLFVLALPAATAQESPDGPATAPNPQFPLRVQVLMTKANGNRLGFHGFGRGNLLGTPEKGIDFTYDCATPFFNNGPKEFYQARWKKPDREIEILMQRIGSDHLDKCRLDIAYKPRPYGEPRAAR